MADKKEILVYSTLLTDQSDSYSELYFNFISLFSFKYHASETIPLADDPSSKD